MSDELTHRQAFTYLMSGSCVEDADGDIYKMIGDVVYWRDDTTDNDWSSLEGCELAMESPFKKVDPPEEPQKEYTFEELLNAKRVMVELPQNHPKFLEHNRAASGWGPLQLSVFDMAIRHKWRIEVEG